MTVPPEVMVEAMPYLMTLVWFMGVLTGWAHTVSYYQRKAKR
ncbi:MAG TPA: hypothetical protein VEP90_24275 [Methylomirabilota bacterium]|nr:hypothetical protein [Methylomirabilota bacterium]